MQFPRKSLALAGAAALVSIGGAAYAVPPWTVSVGGSSTGSPASFTVATVGTDPDIAYTIPGLTLTCQDGTAAGTISPGGTASKAGEITSSSFNGCDGPLGIPFNVTQNATWDINITGDPSGGVTPGEIGNIDAHVSNPDGWCEYDVTGSVGASFDQTTQQLHVAGGGLTVSNVSACFGLWVDGDPMTFEATYQLNNIAPVTITN